MTKPLLLVLDIQCEFIRPDGTYRIESIAPSLENCRTMLDFARENKWEIVHMRHENPKAQQTEYFAEGSEWVKPIEGFEPLDNEPAFTKQQFSSFTDDDFSNFMKQHKQSEVYVIGYNLRLCCMRTIKDASKEGFTIHFVADASRATKMEDSSEETTYETFLGHIKNIENVTITDTKQTIEQFQANAEQAEARSPSMRMF